jgi:superfamily II DNA/RNA helicase
VVLFDFPRDGIEYVRRVGRVTRGTREPGRVTSLLLGRQLAYARELMKANRVGAPIDLEVHSAA